MSKKNGHSETLIYYKTNEHTPTSSRSIGREDHTPATHQNKLVNDRWIFVASAITLEARLAAFNVNPGSEK